MAAALHRRTTKDYKWIADVIAQCVDGVDAKIAWHFCYGNAWGNRLADLFPAGYEAVLPHFYDVPSTSSCSTSPTARWSTSTR